VKDPRHISLAAVASSAQGVGLSLRGAFHPAATDGVPPLGSGARVGTLVLLGWTGGAQWPHFAASPEARDGQEHPLDRWSRRLIDGLAVRFGGAALYPFSGPPYLPFQRWAQKGDEVFASPLGIFIHPVHGLWHSYRGALGFAERLALPQRLDRPNPCETCMDKPCLGTCPVSAFQPGHYDVEGCAAHVRSQAGTQCRTGGCLARRACPVAPHLRYRPDEAGFYAKAFLAAR
jgi:hypothetical protein